MRTYGGTVIAGIPGESGGVKVLRWAAGRDGTTLCPVGPRHTESICVHIIKIVAAIGREGQWSNHRPKVSGRGNGRV